MYVGADNPRLSKRVFDDGSQREVLSSSRDSEGFQESSRVLNEGEGQIYKHIVKNGSATGPLHTLHVDTCFFYPHSGLRSPFSLAVAAPYPACWLLG